jgi:hypothetical protein
MYRPYRLPKTIVQEFAKAGLRFNQNYECDNKDFHIQVIRVKLEWDSYIKWDVRIAIKKTFDRWANSVNFSTDIIYYPASHQYSIPNVSRTLAWCRRAMNSDLFDFDRYSNKIETPDYAPYRKQIYLRKN